MAQQQARRLQMGMQGTRDRMVGAHTKQTASHNLPPTTLTSLIGRPVSRDWNGRLAGVVRSFGTVCVAADAEGSGSSLTTISRAEADPSGLSSGAACALEDCGMAAWREGQRLALSSSLDGATSSMEGYICGADGAMLDQGIEFRVVTEPNRVQPHLPTFGVPYDLVDNSEGGAYHELLQRFQETQLQQQQAV